MNAKKRDVYAKGVRNTTVYDPSLFGMLGNRRFVLRMEDVSGTKDMEGREAQVFLEPREVAAILGSIRASDLEPEDMKPLMHMINFLEKYGQEEK